MDILREFSCEDLYIRYAVDHKPNDRYFSMHVHERYEIFYFVAGSAEYLVEGTKYPLEPGNILIMRPAESHRAKILGSEKYERYAINFSASVLDGIDPQNRLVNAFNDRPLGRGNLYYSEQFNPENIRRLFAEVFAHADDYEQRLRGLTLLFSLLNTLDQDFINRSHTEYLPPQSMTEKVVSYVNAHLFEELSVSSLAKRFFLSDSQFARVFKQATGTSPWRYITIKRLTAAREKIRGGMSAQRAGDDCGFGDYSSFYRAYVKHFNCSPKSDGSLTSDL